MELKTLTKPKFLLFLIFVSISIIISVALGLAYRTYRQVVVRPNRLHNQAKVTPSPTSIVPQPFSVLLLGYGGGTHQGGKLTDSIIVARVDPIQKQVTLISVPRDLWVNLPAFEGKDFYSKINAAYAIGSDDKKYSQKKTEFTGPAGGGQLAKEVLGQVVGFPIDHFVALDFQGFGKSIDTLGGVVVPVQRAFDDYNYPIEGKEEDTCGFDQDKIASLTATLSGYKLETAFECRYEHLHFDKGPQLMDGTTALKFVRSRHSSQDGGDFNRSERQRILITAVKDRIFNLNFLPKAIPFAQTLASHLQTDIDLEVMKQYLSKAEEYRHFRITSVALTDQNVLVDSRSADGQFILSPRLGQDSWDEVHRFINNPNLLTPSPSPSPTPKVSPTPKH
jgi:LCP family protein required for cell wall assembly